MLQPEAPTPGEDFRLMTEFDAQRSELFLARAALLVDMDGSELPAPLRDAVELVVALARGGDE